MRTLGDVILNGMKERHAELLGSLNRAIMSGDLERAAQLDEELERLRSDISLAELRKRAIGEEV